MKNITFINAGAGSGKTHSLTQELYKRINNKELRGDQVLLTTFTRKAAKEIKERVNKELLEHGLAEDAILLQNAYIGTVHSVGYHLISKFCYLIGLSPDISELTEADSDFYFSQAISSIPSVDDLDEIAVLTQKFQFQKFEDDDTKSFDPNKWKEHVLNIINESRRNNIKIQDLSEEGLSFRSSVKFVRDVFGDGVQPSVDPAVIEPHVKSLLKFLENLPDHQNKGRKENGHEVKASIDYRALSYPKLVDIYDIANDILDKVDKANPDAALLVKSIGPLIGSGQLQQDIIKYTRLVFKISRESMDAFKEYKRDHGLVDYTDMETYLLELLTMREVQDELKNTIKLVMVDEFQDSNPVQLNIFIKLAEIADQSVWVGDAKQSIYGFNGADPILVNQILKAFYVQNDQNLKIRVLKNSWRSRPGLVTLCNKMYETSLQDQCSPVTIERDDLLGDETTLNEWLAQRAGPDGKLILTAADTIGLLPVRQDDLEGFANEDAKLPLRHWQFHHDFKGSGNAEQFMYYLGQRIRKLLSEDLPVYDKDRKTLRKLMPSDIAILCRTKKAVKRISAELLKNCIEVAAIVDGLDESAEYRLLINILNYLADPTNSLAVTEILLLVDSDNTLTPESLLEKRLEFLSMAPERNDETTKQYYDYVNAWGKEHPFIQKLDHFKAFSMHLSIPELIEKAVVQLEISMHISAWGHESQRKANIQQLIRYARDYDEYCVKLNIASSLAGFVNWQQSDEEKNYQAASLNNHAVNVLTYHKAKGLEWPYVIITELGYNFERGFLQKEYFRTTVKTQGTLNINNPLDNRYINFSFWPFGAKEKMMGHETIILESEVCREAKKVKEQETKRIMYVGMTRARDYLTTTGFKSNKAPWLELVNSHDGWTLTDITKVNQANCTLDLFGQNMSVNYQFIKDERAEFNDTDYPDQIFAPATYIERGGTVDAYEHKFVSPSKLKGLTVGTAKLLHNFSQRIHIGDIRDESIFGNCLHNILYHWQTGANSVLVETLLARHNLTGRISAEDILRAVHLFKDYMEKLRPSAVYREVPLTMVKQGKVFSGNADLVVEVDRGLILVDYKSYPGKLEDIVNQQGDHYAGKHSAQLDTYAEMLKTSTGKKVLRRIIYYPVVGVIVEI